MLSPQQFPQKINPHQQALPGMEEHAHPWAGMLAKGLTLSYEHNEGSGSQFPGSDYHSLAALHDYHSLAALHGGDGPKRQAGEIIWQGSHNPSKYPGEIDWVENTTHTKSGGKGEHIPGVAQALYRTAHAIDFGQDTVPVHSTVRTEHGEKFAKEVGGPRPPTVHQDYNAGLAWRPPEGLHPYEFNDRRRHEEAAAKMTRKPPKGQRSLF